MADAPPTLLQSTIPGPPGLVWTGAWNPQTLYVERNAVLDNGSAWYSLGQNSNVRPSVDTQNGTVAGTYWQMLARGIPDGKPAITGSKGGNGALSSLIVALVGLGIVTDNTTP